MKRVTFTHDHQTRVGAVVEAMVVDSKNNTKIPATLLEFLGSGARVLEAMQQQIDNSNDRIGLDQVKLHAPMPRPGKYLGISLNYMPAKTKLSMD